MKIIRRFLIFLVVLVVLLVTGVLVLLNSIAYSVTTDDLPQDVYSSVDSPLASAKLQIVGLVLANNDDRYTMMEEIVNLIILDSVRENVNEDYDPLGDCSDTACEYIYYDDTFFINHTYAKLNDNNQLVITIGGGLNKYLNAETALIMVFDIDFDISGMEVVLTLNNYSLGEKQLSIQWLDRIFNYLDKQDIEDSISFGTLDLTDYTYTISISDAMGI